MRVLLIASLAAAQLGCGRQNERVLTLPDQAASLDRASPFLKAHLKDGGLVVLSKWRVNESQRKVSGAGQRFDPHRQVVEDGAIVVGIDQVALFETNVVQDSPTIIPLAIVTGASLALTVFCLADNKACFGSCPTFYRDDKLVAEGFSDSVAPSLEATDIDAIGPAAGGKLALRMTNEAYETHVVKDVTLLAAPRPPGGRVFASADGFFAATRVSAPVACRAEEGDCLAAVAAADGQERRSFTDGRDLADRETLELDFAPQAGPLGIAVTSRQTLLSTYLFYQGLAWMGTRAGAELADLERGGHDLADRAVELRGLLGSIEVRVWKDGAWVLAGTAGETGPLARDTHLVPLPALDGDEPVRVQLRLARGHFPPDAVQLATLAGVVEPRRVAATVIPVKLGHRFGGDRQPGVAFPLVTLPGDVYDLAFEVPPGEQELFLASRGYYLEWLRHEWLLEENPVKAALLFAFPRAALKMLAPLFKQHEDDLEAAFWRSRYVD